ncbi:MAG TPA: hypothetical protein VNV85_09010 [Puia sp.]|jgi:hypothetical protein|nr:hypothetical protein [Puia sp.]
MKIIENLEMKDAKNKQQKGKEKNLQDKSSLQNLELHSFGKAPVIIDMRKRKNYDLM